MSSLDRKMLLKIRLALYTYLAQTVSSTKFSSEKAFCEVIYDDAYRLFNSKKLSLFLLDSSIKTVFPATQDFYDSLLGIPC